MPDFQLYIGYRTTSTWSLRGWMAMRKAGAPFDEVMIRYRRPDDKARIAAVSPTGMVPLLVHRRGSGEVKIWDSLAIGEYLAETFPEKRLWPADPEARAFARSISAEMHSGFVALRNECPMNLHRPVRAVALSDDARANIARVEEIWIDCRRRYGKLGPFLFGAFGGADAMFAPVVYRLLTFAVEVAPEAQAYMKTMMALPAVEEWTRAGLAETLRIERVEAI